MSLLTPFILQLGNCILEDGTGDGPYHVKGMNFPEPEPDGFDGYLPARRTVLLEVTGTTAAELNANISALRREGVRDKQLRWRPPGRDSILECKVREFQMVEADVDPVERGAALKTDVTLTITTDPKWLAPWTAEVVVPQSSVPGHFDIPAPAGETDCPLRIKAVYDDQGTAAAIAVHPDPDPAYDYLDDYGTISDTTDANALGTYKVGEVVDATLDGNEIGTAPSIDTNGNRGPHHLFVRADNNAVTPGNVSMRAITTTTGNLIAESVSVPEQAVAASSADLIGYELGDIQIPAGQVPDLETGSGWSSEAVKASQTTDDGTLTITAPGDAINITQTFPGFTGRITAIEYTIDVAPATLPDGIWLYIGQGTYSPAGPKLATVFLSPLIYANVGTYKVTLPSPVDVVLGATYWFTLLFSHIGNGNNMGFAFGNNRYAAGALSSYVGSGEDADDDLVFKVYGQEVLGFNTSVAVQAACSESSRTVSLDYVQRIPTGYACLIYRRATAGALALFYDGATDTPYSADADGTGPAMLDKCEIRKPLRVKPGVVNRVVLGALQGDEVLGGGTFTYSYRPAFLTATGV